MNLKLIAHLSIALLCTAPAMAQTTGTSTSTPPAQTSGVGDHGGGMRRMLSQLNLSADQQGRIDIIMKSGSKGRERREAVMVVLTDDQKTQMRTLMKAARERRKANGT
jgi:Spy/CpxP family protein refolding chaperone